MNIVKIILKHNVIPYRYNWTLKKEKLMTYYPYCARCLEQPKTGIEADSQFYDFRFDIPVCLSCVEMYNLDPEDV
jgi:hypothetical protein